MQAQADRLSAPGQGRREQPAGPPSGAWRRRLAVAALAGAALVALVVFGLASSGKSARRAPPLPRQVLVGPRPTLAAMLAASHGAPVLLVFWASWCGPCEQEAAAVARFASGPSGRGRVAGVNWSDTSTGARSFIRRFRWSFPNVRDPVGTTGYAYRITGLPTTFVIGRGGLIRQELHGPQTEATLARALAAAS